MRAFVAIDLDERIKASLWGLVEELRAQKANIRWVRKDSFHLTLKFLGNITEEKLTIIKDRLKRAISHLPTFEMEIRGTGVFPSFSRPRVLWAGIIKTEELTALQAYTEDALSEYGFEREKRQFHPHITLGRVRSSEGLNKVLQELRRYKDLEFGKIYVNKVNLMESTLSPEGARYRTVFSIELKN